MFNPPSNPLRRREILLDKLTASPGMRMAAKVARSVRAVRWRENTPTHVWMRAHGKVGEVR